MLPSLTEFSIREPKRFCALLLVLAVCASIGFKNVWLNTDFKASFNSDDPMVNAMKQQESTFTKSDWFILAIASKSGDLFTPKNLKAIETLTEKGWQAPYSLRVDSITNYNHVWGQNDELNIEPLLEDSENKSSKELETAKGIILASQDLVGSLISKNGTSSIISIQFELPENPTSEVSEITSYLYEVVKQAKKDNPQLIFHRSGSVENTQAFTDATLSDAVTLLPIAYFMMIFFMLLMFRSIVATIMVLTVVSFSSTLALGIKCWLDGNINAVNMVAPTIIMTIAVADCVHILLSFLQKYRNRVPKITAIKESVSDNFGSILLTTATTTIGFLCLNFHESPPYRELGNIVAGGVIIAFLLCISMLPAMLALIPIKRTGKPPGTKLTKNLASFCVSYHRSILIFFTIALITVVYIGLPKNSINEKFTEYLDESYEFRRANNFVNENITGIHRVFYTLDSGKNHGIHDVNYQAYIEDFSNWLRLQPGIAHVSSYTDIIKQLNKAMQNNSDAEYKLPNNRELASQYSLLYELSLPFGQGLTNIVSLDKSKTLVTAIAWETDSKELVELNRRAEEWLENNRPENSQHLEKVSGTGLDLMFMKLAENNIPSMVYGTIASMILISFLLMIAFKSVKLGIISIISNTLPATLAFSIWGMIDGRIGISVAAVTILTLGLVVDDTIHFLNKYNNYRNSGKSVINAIEDTLQTSGLAMLVITLIFSSGFGVLSVSHYSANADLGIMTAITIFVAVCVDLIVLPSLLIFLAGKTAADSRDSQIPNIKYPPQPPKGILGHIPLLANSDSGCFYDAAKKLHENYGPIVEINILGEPWVLVSDIDMIHDIFIGNREKYSKTGAVIDEMTAIMGDKGILVTEGELWEKQRKMMMPAFRQEKLKLMMNDMNAIAISASSELEKNPEFSASDFVNQVGLAIICKTAVDYNLQSFTENTSTDPLLAAEDLGTEQLMIRIQRTKYWKKLPLPVNFKLKKLIENSNKILLDIVHQRNEPAENSPFLIDMLKSSTDDYGNKMDDEELVQMLHQTVAAGHGTSGGLMQWTLYYLSTHPNVQEKIRQEINLVVGDEEHISFDKYKDLTYTSQVIKEVLRIRPPIPIMLRATEEAVDLKGFHLKKGSSIMAMIGVLQNNPEIWGDNHNFFDPENFTETAIKNRPKHCFIPFGIGPRICVGHQFSMLETIVVISQFIRRFNFCLKPNQKIEPFLRLVWGTKDDLYVVATPIENTTTSNKKG